MRAPLAALMALAIVAGACTSSPDSSTASSTGVDPGSCPVDALDGAEGTVEVVMWETLTGEPLRMMQELVERYNASQDTVRVRMENQGTAYAEMQRKFVTAVGTGDLPALIPLEDTQTQFMADSGIVVPAQACAEADNYDLDQFLPLVRNFYSVDGALQPAASNLSTTVQYYNRDHFEAAGLDPDSPPENLAELRSAAEAIQAAGITDRPFVMLIQPWFLEQWLTGAGVEMVNNNNGRDGLATESRFDNETTREIYQWLADLAADGLLNAIPGTEGQVDHYFAMALEQSSITLETSTAISTINAVLEGTLDPAEVGLDVGELPAIDIDVDVAPYPGVRDAGKVQPGGGAFYLPRDNAPEVIAGAWDFIKWFNEATTQADWMQGATYMAWNAATYDNPDVVAWEANTRPGRWLSVAVEEIENTNPDFPGPLIGPYTEVRDAIRLSLDAMLLGSTPPEEAVAQADQAISAALERYADENF